MRDQAWPEKMEAEIAKARRREFVWGEHDCCLFAANVILAMTGFDCAAQFRGRYSTKIGAARVIKSYAGGGLREAAIALLGQPIPPELARRGDVVCAGLALGATFGICIGSAACFAAPVGLITIPMTACSHAWRVD